MNLLLPLAILGLLAVSQMTSKSPTISSPSKPYTGKIKVALYKSYGVSEVSFNAGKDLLSNRPNVEFSILTASDIRNGKLDDKDIVIFLGGSGSQQGKDLQSSGRDKVKNFVKNGGNYIGVCGGAYLALQGSEEFNKLAIVAAKSYGNYWQRGVGDALCKTNDGQEIYLHYENGPVFQILNVEGIPALKSLATFQSDFYIASKGTQKGEMPGKPAITLSKYGKGKVLLFSPNPIIGGEKVYHPELILNGMKWMMSNNNVDNIKFSTIFGM